MTKHLLKHHLTITQFAKKKNVARQTVYVHIRFGWIEPDIIGMEPDGRTDEPIQMIDWKRYGKYIFNDGKKQTDDNNKTK